jgi:hypothetical protein
MKQSASHGMLIAGTLSAAALITAAHASAPALSRKAFAPAVGKYLEEKGNFCLGKFDWPISVTDADRRIGTNDALQMPVMEKLGLVVAAAGDDPGVKRYRLTDEGKKYYLVKKTVTLGPIDKPIEHAGDFCAAKLTLDKVVRWQPPTVVKGKPQTTVMYTYKIAAAAEWTRDPDIQRVFPMIHRILDGAGSVQLMQGFVWSDKAWVAAIPGG